ncbi:hypothetical protein N7491_005841 [Penicillium cf. griseofulvum]|uniref:Uncharacterized protein n=1 Tax=Penicillium cf. griseofulvum TaxID=2972120 RepID=A0A9W9J4C1_9EURO|nr:hypothetical protein N7472_008526 [Penicillium cf. griseofulvum]KAJ5435246.1 hypothetical protein N7491_005841 [Penicillium cf. griseofulvum]KAJ5453080.1 hypothetical protein N7445_001263 [Penicillium cf. griseofulvum]
MASPSFTHFDHLQVPGDYERTMTDFDYSQFAPLTYQSSTSILAEPYLVSANPHLYTNPIESVAFGFPASASPSTCSDRSPFNQNAMHQSPTNDDCAAMAPAGHVDPRHDIACATSPASTTSVQVASQVRATSDDYTKGKRPSGRNRGRQQRQE